MIRPMVARNPSGRSQGEVRRDVARRGSKLNPHWKRRQLEAASQGGSRSPARSDYAHNSRRTDLVRGQPPRPYGRPASRRTGPAVES
jgi:hypothetical protein